MTHATPDRSFLHSIATESERARRAGSCIDSPHRPCGRADVPTTVRRRLGSGRTAASIAAVLLTAAAPVASATAGPRGDPSVVSFDRDAAAWLAAAPCNEGYAFDEFFPGIASGGGCLSETGIAPVVLPVSGGMITISLVDAFGQACPVVDASSNPAVSDVPLGGPTAFATLSFDPPITAFYAFHGSLEPGARHTLALYDGTTLVATLETATSGDPIGAIGHGFTSEVPIDRIEVTTDDTGTSILGAFTGLLGGESSLGTRRIDDYGGPGGSIIEIDFAVAFDGPADRVLNTTRDTVHRCVRDAIDWAHDGDTLVLMPGVHRESIDLLGKSLTLTSVDPDDPAFVDQTRLDAFGTQASAIRCANGEAASTTIRGITISGAVTDEGGGAFVANGSSPTFDRCVFTTNRAARGGGVFVEAGCQPDFIDCTFFSNVAHDSGGGVWSGAVEVAFERCIFQANSAPFGAGLRLDGASGALVECLFEANLAQTRGGGVLMTGSSVIVDACTFLDNGSRGQGGGLAATGGGSVEIFAAAFEGNYASGDGGAIHAESADLSVTDSRFDGNTAARGSAASLAGPTIAPYFVGDCLFLGNEAPRIGSGVSGSGCVFARATGDEATRVAVQQSLFNANAGVALVATGGATSMTLRHLTVVGSTRASVGAHDAASIAISDAVLVDDASDAFVTSLEGQILWRNCLVRGGGPNGGGGSLGENLDSEPMFIDPLGADGLAGTIDDDFRPTASSPLVDAATMVAAATELDLDGVPRTIGRLDIGAYEFAPDCDGSGVADHLEIAAGTLDDCNGNLLADSCESILDCNGNGIIDECDIAAGVLTDANGNGYPDECEAPGAINGVATWSEASNPVVIMAGSVLVTGTLTIESGVTVLAAPDTSMTIAGGGALQVDGSADASVVLRSTTVDVLAEPWGGVRFLPGSTGTIAHARISGIHTSALRIDDAEVTIRDSIVHDVIGLDGATAMSAGAGERGGDAGGVVIDGASIVSVERCTMRSISGGRGGDGGFGTAGTDGQHGQAGQTAGEDGQSGTAATIVGTPGGIGGDGGDAFGVRCNAASVLLVRDTSAFDLRGGAGGRGGRGGRGGNGGFGGRGMLANVIPNRIYWPIWYYVTDADPGVPEAMGVTLNGGDGGSGGDGTDGGGGGAGGHGGRAIGFLFSAAQSLACDQNVASDLRGGAGGAGGRGGSGGRGGDGGLGGFAGALSNGPDTYVGDPGWGGDAGNAGDSGPGGAGGASGSVIAMRIADSNAGVVDAAQWTVARIGSGISGEAGAAGLPGSAGEGGDGGRAMLPLLIDDNCPDGVGICERIVNTPVVAEAGVDGFDGQSGRNGAPGAIGVLVGVEAEGAQQLFLANAILDAIDAESGTGERVGVRANGDAVLSARACVIHGFTTPFGEGAANIGPGTWTFDPSFVDPLAGDYRLRGDSPAIDVGDDGALPPTLALDLDGFERIVDGDEDGTATVDPGAFEFAATVTPCPADLDGDGMVSASDLTILLGTWGESGAADLDGSGAVDASDLTIVLGSWGLCS